MRNERAIIGKFKMWNGKSKNIEKLKARLTRHGYTEEQITDFETRANGE